jgi:hypothetical protein
MKKESVNQQLIESSVNTLFTKTDKKTLVYLSIGFGVMVLVYLSPKIVRRTGDLIYSVKHLKKAIKA